MTDQEDRVRGNTCREEFVEKDRKGNGDETMVVIEHAKTEITKEGVIFYKEQVKKWKTV